MNVYCVITNENLQKLFHIPRHILCTIDDDLKDSENRRILCHKNLKSS